MEKNKLFEVGDRVRISKGSEWYGTSTNNPADTDGTVIEVDPKSSWVYRVLWDNSKENNYGIDDLYLVSEKATSDLVQVPEEFVMEAYKSACSDWKKKIRSEVPDLYLTVIMVRKEFVREAYAAADSDWKKRLEKRFEFLRGPEFVKIADGEYATDLYYKTKHGFRKIEGVNILHGVAGDYGIPEQAKGCGFYLTSDMPCNVVIKKAAPGQAVYFEKK